MNQLAGPSQSALSQESHPSKQQALALGGWDGLVALFAGLLALFIYGRTVVPGLLPGDSGEFQTLVYLLGPTHPTGYPVYLLLARLFSLIPSGDLAYRANLFSALMGAAAIGGVYLTGRLIGGYRATAAAGALALAVAPTFWSQALIAEVYTAGAAFFVFILLALFWWEKTGSRWALFTAGMLGGLSLGVHMSIVLLAPAVLLFLLLHWQRGRSMWKTAASGAFAGLALTILLFTLIDLNDPTAGYFNSVVEPSRSAWGYEAGQIDGTLEHLLFGWQGRQFQYLMFSGAPDLMARQAGDYFSNLGDEMALPFMMLTVLGALALLMRRPRTAILLLVALLVQLIYFFNYEIWDLYVFYIPSYLLLTLLAIAGLGAIITLTNTGLARLFGGHARTAAALDAVLAILVLLFAVGPLFQPHAASLIAGEVPFDRDEYPQYDLGLALVAAATVAELPRNAIVFTSWDMMWPYYHAAHLQSDRVDLTFIETWPADDQQELADSLIAYLLAHIDTHPLFFESRPPRLAQMTEFAMAPKRIGPQTLVALTRK